MDRFKFRVWDKVSKRYFYLELKFGDNGYNPDFITDPVFEQCVGLKDKNGDLIYEGDRVRADVERGYPCAGGGGAMECDIETITGYVRWDEGGGFVINRDNGACELFGNILTPDDIEIIGNIYEKE